MKLTETKTIWKCDRCKTQVVSLKAPNTVADCWATATFAREDGFDHLGDLVGPGAKLTMDLCGKCGTHILTELTLKT